MDYVGLEGLFRDLFYQNLPNLAEQLLYQGRTLYIDNFYTSYELAKCFLDKKTHVVGTLRANKKDIPKDVLHAKLKRGDMISREDENGIVVLKWRDTRDVRMLTTKHAPVMAPVTVSPLLSQPTPSIDEPTTSRRSSRRVTEKPLPVLAYNSGKAGIDLSDQMASYVTTLRKGIKVPKAWFRAFVRNLYGQCVGSIQKSLKKQSKFAHSEKRSSKTCYK